MMDPNKYYNNNPCMIEQGIVGGNSVSLFSGNMVNLENDLTGRTRAKTRCPSGLYLPGTVIQGQVHANCRHRNKSISCSLNTANCGCTKKMLVDLPSCKLINYKDRVNYNGISPTVGSKSAGPAPWAAQFTKAWTE